MTTLNYTKAWGESEEFTSTSVDGVYYNANERFAVIDWDNNLYRYDNVDEAEVLAVVRADSVGTAANSFKVKHGPGTFLGTFWELEYNEVAKVISIDPSASTTVINNSVFAPTAVPVDAGSSAGLSVLSNNFTYELFFDLNGIERTHLITDKNTLEGALNSLHDAAAALGVPIVVKKAVVTFV